MINCNPDFYIYIIVAVNPITSHTDKIYNSKFSNGKLADEI